MNKKATKYQRKNSHQVSSDPKHQVNIQNNYYIDATPNELAKLRQQDPELARDFMEMMKLQQKHNIQAENRILSLEEKEQEERINEAPFARKYILRGQIFGFVSILFTIGVVAFCAINNNNPGAVASGIAGIIIALSQFYKKKPNPKDRK